MSDEVLSRIAAWCEGEPGMEFADGDPPSIVFEGHQLTLDANDMRIVITHRAAGDEATARGALSGAPMARAATEGSEVVISHPVYIDGMTTQAFMEAVYSVGRAAQALAATPAVAAQPEPEPEPTAVAEPLQPAAAAAAEPAWAATHRVVSGMKVWPEPNPTAQPIAQFQEPIEVKVAEERGAWAKVSRSDGWGGWVDGRQLQAIGVAAAQPEPVKPAPQPQVQQTQPQPQVQQPAQQQPVQPQPVQPQPAQQAYQQPYAQPQQAAAWAPTHEVPAGGMPAWSEPNPQLQPVTQLAERVQLRVDEQRGAWAKVTGSNGWTGWVDSRNLPVLGAGAYGGGGAAAAAGTGAGTVMLGNLAVRIMPTIGALAAGIAVILPWLRNPFAGSANGFDVPMPFLWDYTSASSFDLAYVILILAVLGLAVGLFAQLDPRIAAVVGFLLLAIGVAFIIQVIRAISDGGGSASDAFGDWIGFAPYIVAVGGVIMLVGGLQKK